MVSPFPSTRRAGELILMSGFDGRCAPGDTATSVIGQCEHVYGAMTSALAAEGLAPSTMVRLDHFTRSQDWLADRQQARAAAFGRPAGLASTGVATLHDGQNLLTAMGIAWGGATAAKQVAIAGADFGMPAIATAVQAGPWVFISGLLATRPDEVISQLEQILARLGLDGNAIVRLDTYVSGPECLTRLDELISARLTNSPIARTGAVLPFASPNRLEVTALASRIAAQRHCVDGVTSVAANDVLFTGAITAGHPGSVPSEIAQCLERLALHMAVVGRDMARIARLEVCLADPDIAELVRAQLSHILAPPHPALMIWAGDGVGPFHLKIAVVGG